LDEPKFPNTLEEALAYLYIKHQDLAGKSPEEIHTMYWEAYYAIQADDKAKQESSWYAKHDPNNDESKYW